MRRYMHEYSWKHADFAPFSINAHANAMHNPFARLHQKINTDQFEKSSMVATPINLLDASPTGDGAAAVVLVPAEKVASLKGKPRVTIAGSASSTDSIAVHSRKDPLFLSAAYELAKRAYEMANVTPEDIDVFELHDAFSIMSALSLEACGFSERGQGVRLGLDNEIGPTGRVPICTRGGLKRVDIRSARQGCIRSWRLPSNCAVNVTGHRSMVQKSAWPKILGAPAPPS